MQNPNHELFKPAILAEMITEQLRKKSVFERIAKKNVFTGAGMRVQVRVKGDKIGTAQKLEAYQAIPKGKYTESLKDYTIGRYAHGIDIALEDIEATVDDVPETIVQEIVEVIVDALETEMVQAVNAEATLREPLSEPLTAERVIQVKNVRFLDEAKDGKTFLVLHPVDYTNLILSSATSPNKVVPMTFREGDAVRTANYIEDVEILSTSYAMPGKPFLLKEDSVFRTYKGSDKVRVTQDWDNDTDVLTINGRILAAQGVRLYKHVVQFDGAVVPTP